MVPQEIKEIMNEDMLALLKMDFTVALEQFDTLPDEIRNEVWEYAKVPEENRLEIIEALETCINEEISAELQNGASKLERL